MEFDKLFMGGVLILLAFGVIHANLPGKNKKKAENEAENETENEAENTEAEAEE